MSPSWDASCHDHVRRRWPDGDAADAASTLEAFGVQGRNLLPLAGGQRQAWLAGDVVLKQVDSDLETMEWVERLSLGLDGRSDFRVAPPVRTVDGGLIGDGWTGWRYEPGDPASSRYWQFRNTWDEVLNVGDALNSALAGKAYPPLLDRRTDRWAAADAVVWGLTPTGSGGEVVRYLKMADEHSRPVDAASQLIHGDLTGNVLFAEGRPPLIIDFSPYWRPPAFALAIVVVDVLAHHTGGRQLTARQSHRPDFDQYLVRAALFRLLSDPPQQPLRYSPYAGVLEYVCQLIERQRLGR